MKSKLTPLIAGLGLCITLAPLAQAQTPASSSSTTPSTPPTTSTTHHHHPDLMKMLSDKLNLTDAEKAQIKPFVTQTDAQIKAIHHEEHDKTHAAMTKMNSQIMPYLTKDQQAQLTAMQNHASHWKN